MRLSVVVAVVDGGEALRRCLVGLSRQQDGPPLELIVPWDASAPEVPGICADYPLAQPLAMGAVATAHAAGSALAAHELYDRRRAAGLAAATGDLVALVEDRVVPREDWSRALTGAHGMGPDVVGGAVDCRAADLLGWAVYYCDYGRYQPPFIAHAAEWLSDVNVSYKRAALEQTRSLWQQRYQEPLVHGALARAGARMLLSPAPVVDAQRGPLRLGAVLRERVVFARVFAATRAREASTARRALLAAASLALPLLLVARRVRERSARGPLRAKSFLAALPLIALLSCAWSFGELLGYLRGEA